MNKLSPRTEEILLIIAALFILVFSLFNTLASGIIAVICLIFIGIYNFLTRKES